MMHNKVSAEYPVVKTMSVWWDIDFCQIPHGYDPYQVRPSIESALEKYFGPGPLTIIAIGNIKRVPRRVLEPISSSGISIKHAALGVVDIGMDIHLWALRNPPPATIMLISDKDSEDCFESTLSHYRDKGYTILRAFPNHQRVSPKYASKVWLWESLLTDAMDSGSADTKQETRRQALQEKCIETGEPAWFCRLCRVAAQTFDNFTTHLEGQEHALNELRLVPKNATCLVNKKNLQKRNLVAGPSEKEASLDPQPKNATNMVKNQPKKNLQKRNLVAGPSQKEASLDPQPKNAT